MPFLAFLQKSIPFGSGKPISEMNPIFGDRLELSEAASIFVKAFSGDKRKWVMKFKTMPVSKTCRSMLVGVITRRYLLTCYYSHSTVADCLLQVEARQESGGLEPSAQRGKEWIRGAVLGARV